MKYISPRWLILPMILLLSCKSRHEIFMRELDQIKSNGTEQFTVVYALSAYLSTTSRISADEAVPLILELISYGNYTEARYCIENLKRNGVHSPDLLALRGLCYYNELHSELALADLEEAHTDDPGNAKITTLLDRVKGIGESLPTPDELIDRAAEMISSRRIIDSESLLDQVLELQEANHRALFYKAVIRLHLEEYDSALYYLTFALSSEPLDRYNAFINFTQMAKEGDVTIRSDPSSYQGYLQKSRGLASMDLIELAQVTLDQGLEKNPENLNLILAKALVWVQAGQEERARNYIQGLERRGLTIDPALKERIFLEKQE